jgi:hypothetical protein
MDVPHLPDRKTGKRFCDPGENSLVLVFFYDSYSPSSFLCHHSFLFFDNFAFPLKMSPPGANSSNHLSPNEVCEPGSTGNSGKIANEPLVILRDGIIQKKRSEERLQRETLNAPGGFTFDPSGKPIS